MSWRAVPREAFSRAALFRLSAMRLKTGLNPRR
jgi:hypothetical protein